MTSPNSDIASSLNQYGLPRSLLLNIPRMQRKLNNIYYSTLGHCPSSLPYITLISKINSKQHEVLYHDN